MNEIKDIFERVLTAPAPPLRGSAEIVAGAHRAARRRSALRLAGSGLVVAVIAVAFFAITGGLAAKPDPKPVVIGTVEPAPVRDPMPDQTVLDTHISRIATTIRAAIPSDLSAGDASVNPWQWEASGGGHVLSLIVPLTASDGTGDVEVTFGFQTPAAVTPDLCTAAVAAQVDRFSDGATRNCHTITVNGQPIRITTNASTPASTIAATRFLDGGFVTVVSAQRPPDRSPLTEQQVAALAANPALL